MNFFTNKKIINKIIIAILLVTLFNFMAPTVSKAEDEIGGGLFKPIAQLLFAAGDWIFEGLEKYFIDSSTKKETDTFKYSPAIIFSGNVTALDINFFNPSEDISNKEVVSQKIMVELDRRQVAQASSSEHHRMLEDLKKFLDSKIPNRGELNLISETYDEAFKKAGKNTLFFIYKFKDNENGKEYYVTAERRKY